MPSDPPIRSEADSNPFRSPAFAFEPSEPNLRPEKKPVKAAKRSKTPFADDGDPLRALAIISGDSKPQSPPLPRSAAEPAEDDLAAKRAEKVKARDKIPVARKVVRLKIPKLKIAEDEEVEGPIFTKREAMAWGISIAIYTLFLIFLATRFLSTRNRDELALTTSLPPGGDPFGDDSGLTDKMGGVEVPPALPEVEGLQNSPFAEAPTLTSMVDPPPDAKAILQPTNPDSIGGDGLSGKGKGGGTGGEGFGLARFGSGAGENVQGVKVKVGDPQFTLIWDTQADLDLHIIEPGSSEIFWEKPRGDRGGELDVDDQDGFGPENVYWGEERGEDGRVKVKGKGPAGTYRWFVVYYGGFGGHVTPTRWKVRVKHNGTVSVYQGRLTSFGQRSKNYTLDFHPDGNPTAHEEDDAKPVEKKGASK